MRKNAALLGLLSAAPGLAPAQTAAAPGVLPSGGTVVSGAATITSSTPSSLVIEQGTARAVINWNSFSVGQPNAVTFNQPGQSAAILNRVTGSTASTIAGQITGNGQVFLVNPNGIAITPSGRVSIGGGFVGSSLSLDDADFNSGRLNFHGDGTSASVLNEGSIEAGIGTYVGLLGGTVEHRGAIDVQLGRVGLGSGEAITLDLAGDGFMQVAAPTNATTADGRPLLDVAGVIRSAGGSVQVSTATARQAIRDAVNVSGQISALSLSGIQGSIQLSAGEGGLINLSGELDVSGPVGGRIDASGHEVHLTGASLNASGADAGGLIRIGGEFRGGAQSDLGVPGFSILRGPFRHDPCPDLGCNHDGGQCQSYGRVCDRRRRRWWHRHRVE